PILIYTIPQFAGVYLMQETVARLAEHPNIIGLKDSAGDLTALKDLFRELKTSEFSVLVGSPMILTQALDAGCAGAVLAVAAIAPNTACAISRAYDHNNYERAEELQKRLAGLARVTAASGIGFLKAAMDMVGLYGFMPRSPMPAPTDAERADIEKAIEESELFEKVEDGQWREIERNVAPQFAD